MVCVMEDIEGQELGVGVCKISVHYIEIIVNNNFMLYMYFA